MKLAVAILVLSLAPITALAAETACPEHFAAGQAPDLVNTKLAAKTRELCNNGYGLLHSGVTRTGLWSAEHLTRERLERQQGLDRKNTFHAESRLPPDERAELADYKGSGYDRGHMAPSGDMPDARSQNESFSLANMVPQAGALNRGIWEGIESATRDLTRRQGEVYVVTGAIFQGQNLKRIGGRVLVPSHVFKAVYDPRQKRAAAYLAANQEDAGYQRVSIAELTQVAGMDPFPGLPAATKAAMLDLPQPKPRGNGKKAAQAEPIPEKGVLDYLRQLLR
ncbi:DNA/RNA non-specific endonuclease [Azospirillum melinis]|uniref:DNA/RNA non-specific endonuclease n=1 Tax=Azospirillum melinis TaxID=328839 RepID=UPI003756F94F